MNILLTGANGFVGKSIVNKLASHNVILTSRSNLSQNQGVYFAKKMSSTEDFSDCLKNIEVIIHTAGRAHRINDKAKDPKKKYMEVNCFGTLNLARQAAKAGVKRFIYLSSIKVNGEKSTFDEPFKYDDVINPKDDYGRSKAEAERGLLKIASETKLEVTIIRPPLIYGVGVKANFATLIKFASRNLPFPLGAVQNKKSFVFIDNLTSLIITCIDHSDATNQVFLVSDDCDVSTKELYEKILQVHKKKARIININLSFLEFFASLIGKKSLFDRLCSNLRVDIKHTKQTLKWSPPVTFDKGIIECVKSIEAIKKEWI